MSTRRLALEIRALDGRAIGGRRVQPLLSDFPERHTGIRHKKPGECPCKLFSAAARVLVFFVWLSCPPPPALAVTGDLD
jgi:hypothetical protein